MLTGGRQPDARHVAVDRLVLPGAHAVGLVPDADVARPTDDLVEALPRRQVPRVRVARVAVELLERAPELHERRASVHPTELGAEEAGLRVGLELLHHGRHGAEDHERPPQLPRPVEAHADEEDDEVALERGAVTTGEDGHAATVIAIAVARNVGLPVEQPVLVSIGSNVIVRLAPDGPVARVSGLVDRVRDTRAHFTRDVAIARHLAVAGAPAVRPAEPAGPHAVDGRLAPPAAGPSQPAGPHAVDGRVVTFWEWVAPPGAPAGPEIGRALRACHEAVAGLEVDLPPLQSLLDEASVVAGRGALTVDDRNYVRVELERVSARIAALGLPERPLHGDAGLGNVLPGPRWNDWEDACLGPPAWDRACLVTTARVQNQDRERAEAALAAAGEEPAPLFVRGRALQATAWSSLAVTAGTTTPQRLARRLAWLRRAP